MMGIHWVHTHPTLRMVATIVLLFLLGRCFIIKSESTRNGRGGSWELLLNSSGVVAMHMALTHHNTVIIFDQTESGRSGYQLHSHCTCWAHSVEYDISSSSIRPLHLLTDTWCSSGSLLSDGTLAQTGGHGDGSRRIRHFRPCHDRHCDWTQSDSLLAERRWYATNQILPEKDQMIVVGGLDAYSYELVPKSSAQEGAYRLPFLQRARNRREEGDNLYPLVHLSSDGNLFIFANQDSVLLDYHSHRVVRHFPRIHGSGARSYPSTGSSVMLPLHHADGFRKVEVMVCGGGAAGAYRATKTGEFLEGLSSCGRIVITDESPKWVMEDMPGARLMSDMLILPTGDVLLINGATHGCAGWHKARNPSHNPYLYKPEKKVGKRFSVLNSSEIARMYHSSAIVLPDGRVLVAGSNPHRKYTFSHVRFPTELRVEAFVPYYMGAFFDRERASNLSIDHGDGIRYGEEFEVWFELARRPDKVVEFHAYAPPFATHSFSMNQRMLKLECISMMREKGGRLRALLVAPPSPTVAPSGYYLLTVVNGGIPSKSEWVRFIHAY